MYEIERKYLVKKDIWHPSVEGIVIKQGYLSSGVNATVRVRTADIKAYLTIKGTTTGITRLEFEYEIPYNDASELLRLCGDNVVKKIRYKQKYHNKLWEIDVFKGLNEGLVVAEIELTSETETFDLPDWVGEEVSMQTKYYNAALARNPFCQW